MKEVCGRGKLGGWGERERGNEMGKREGQVGWGMGGMGEEEEGGTLVKHDKEVTGKRRVEDSIGNQSRSPIASGRKGACSLEKLLSNSVATMPLGGGTHNTYQTWSHTNKYSHSRISYVKR